MIKSIDVSNNKVYSFNCVANSQTLHLSPNISSIYSNNSNVKYLINLSSNCNNVLKGCLTNNNNGKYISLETCQLNNINQHFEFKKISCDNDRKDVYKGYPDSEIIIFPNLVPYPYFIITPSSSNTLSYLCVTIDQDEDTKDFKLRVMPFRGLETQCFNMVRFK